MSRPDTWMPMYWRDFWADTGHLSPVEGWAYVNLIGAYWTIGGPLENDDARLARQAKVSPKEWKVARPAVIAFFSVDDKLIHHKRIDAELAVATARHAAKVKAGASGAQKRWQTDSKPIAELSLCHRQTDAQLQPQLHSDANASDGGEEPKGFQDLMAVYPKRHGTNPRPKALKAWYAAIERGATPEQIIEAAKSYACTDVVGTQYTAQTATWLEGDEWKNQPAPVGPSVDPEDARWSLRIDGFDRRRFWNHDQWGPAPDQPGCKAPKRLLESRQVAA